MLAGEDPYKSFNFIWSQWIKSLSKQLPDLAEAFDDIDVKLHALANDEELGVQEPMRLFVKYIGEHLPLLFAHDAKLFQEIYIVSGGQCLPPNFVDRYNAMTPEKQKFIWGTLDTMVHIAGLTNAEFGEIVRETKEKLRSSSLKQ